MKIYSLLSPYLLSLLISLPAYPQISGRVQDKDNQPLPFANVLLLSAQYSSLVRGMVTNKAGEFTMSLPAKGTYLLAVSMIGYLYIPIDSSTITSLELVTFNLEENIQELGEVVVRAQKPLYERQLDRLVVNVQNSITSAGGSVLDILERSPGVVVNRQNGLIALNGKDNVAVMINGKLSRMSSSSLVELLQGMNGSTIETIELISNPPARYDAEGTGGLINIVTKKNPDLGTHGSASLSAGYSYGEKYAAGMALSHRREKLHLFGDYSFSRNRTHQLFKLSHVFDEEKGQYASKTVSKRLPIITNHTVRLGFDYDAGVNTTVGGLISAYTNHWQMDAFNETFINDVVENNLIQTDNTESNHGQHMMGNISLSHTFIGG